MFISFKNIVITEIIIKRKIEKIMKTIKQILLK